MASYSVDFYAVQGEWGDSKTITSIPTSARIDSITLKKKSGELYSPKTWTLWAPRVSGKQVGVISNVKPDSTARTFSNSSYNNVKGQTTMALKWDSPIYDEGGTLTVTINYTANSTYWSSTSTLSLSRSGTSVTATKGGTAVNSLGSSVTYYLYEGSTNKGTFSGNTLTLNNVSAGTHTYKVVASAGGLTANGASASITVPAAAITWSDATLTLVQNGTDVTATMGGTATHNYGSSVTYYLYEGSTQIGAFSGNTLTFTPSVGEHTYKTVATAGGISADGASASITVVPPYKTIKIYDGSAWVECLAYYYDGTQFVETEPYYYDGASFQECSHT